MGSKYTHQGSVIKNKHPLSKGSFDELEPLSGELQDKTSGEDQANDYSGIPKEISVSNELASTMGSATGEEENAIEAGGWQGTDDATSTAPSDYSPYQIPQKENPLEHLDEEDPTGRAYGVGFNRGEGGIADVTGRPVEGSRNWDKDAIDFDAGP